MADPGQDFEPFIPSWLDTTSPASQDALGAVPSWLPAPGFPANAEPVPGLGIPASTFDQAAAQADTAAPMDPAGAQPGLGIPVQTFDAAAAQAPQPGDPQSPGDVAQQAFAPVNFVQNAVNPIDAEQLAPGPADQLPTPSFQQYDVAPATPFDDLNATPEDRDAYAKRLAVTDPEAFADLQVKQWHAQEEQRLTEDIRASKAQQDELNTSAEHTRLAAVHANEQDQKWASQATELAARPIDPHRWWSSRTTGQKIANVIGALGGALAVSDAAYHGQYGMRNQFLDGMQKDIDDDIALQKDAIVRGVDGITAQRGIVADIFKRTGDMNQATTVAKLAALGQAHGQVLKEQQLRDSRGTQSIELGKTAQAIAMAAAQTRDAAMKTEFARAKDMLDMQKTLADIEKTKAETVKLGRGAGAGGGAVLTPAEWSKKHLAPGAPWGAAEQAAYNAYAAKATPATVHAGAAAPAAPPMTFGAAAPATIASPVAKSATGKVAAPTKAAAQTPGQPAAASAAPQQQYKTKDDWFSSNRPTITPEQREKYWFVDGNNGNTAPPVDIEGSKESATKFIDRQKQRRGLAEKVDQLRVLTEHLRGRGFWDKAVGNRISWKNDADVQEARALAEDVTGDIIQEKGMGVPSGNDVERVKTMAGGDPAGWQDPTPNLQRYRESLQLAQDSDWGTFAPEASKDKRYIPYKVLPTASKDWVAKFQGRGQVKTLHPEEANTDAEQLTTLDLATPNSAPDVEQAAHNAARAKRLDAASQYLIAVGFEKPVAAGGKSETETRAQASDALTGRRSSSTEPGEQPVAPQFKDFDHFQGPPEAKRDYDQLAKQYVNSVANLVEYRHGKEEYWDAFQKNTRLMTASLEMLLHNSPGLSQKLHAQHGTDGFAPGEVARLTHEILASGAKI